MGLVSRAAVCGAGGGREGRFEYVVSVAARLPEELARLADALDVCERDAAALVAGLDEARGQWRPAPGAWSVAECLDHLATSNRVYLAAMEASADRARRTGRLRSGPARPGLIGRWFVRQMEPPVKTRMRAPAAIRPRSAPALADAYASLLESHAAVRRFMDRAADLDLSGTRFPNPFVSGIRFSLATGLHVIPAHERRHLWQAWCVREAEARAARSPAAAGAPRPARRV